MNNMFSCLIGLKNTTMLHQNSKFITGKRLSTFMGYFAGGE
jgi:hypothetical protein